MNILFYIEPLTERGNPTAKRAWLIFCSMMAKSVRQSNPAATFFFIMSDALRNEPLAYKNNNNFAEFEQVDFVPRFGRSTLSIASHWYRGGNFSSRNEMAELLRGRVKGFRPDICITFSPAPFLSTAFPDASVLHFEHGMLSRPPFPLSGFLDPVGMVASGYPNRHKEELSRYLLSEPERALICGLRDNHLAFLSATNPFKKLMREIKKKFSRIVLLALQSTSFYAYDCHAEFEDQFDLLASTLANASNSTAIVVSEHPQFSGLSADAIRHFQKKYENFIWIPESRTVSSASYYLMEYADVVITVSSSVGLLTLLWRKALIVSGSSHLVAIADSRQISDIEKQFSPDWPHAKENLLAWHLTRYSIPFPVLFDGVFGRILEKAIRCRGSGYATFYEDPFASIADIANCYRLGLLAAQEKEIIGREIHLDTRIPNHRELDIDSRIAAYNNLLGIEADGCSR